MKFNDLGIREVPFFVLVEKFRCQSAVNSQPD
jgi:hypothetical protein